MATNLKQKIQSLDAYQLPYRNKFRITFWLKKGQDIFHSDPIHFGPYRWNFTMMRLFGHKCWLKLDREDGNHKDWWIQTNVKMTVEHENPLKSIQFNSIHTFSATSTSLEFDRIFSGINSYSALEKFFINECLHFKFEFTLLHAWQTCQKPSQSCQQSSLLGQQPSLLGLKLSLLGLKPSLLNIEFANNVMTCPYFKTYNLLINSLSFSVCHDIIRLRSPCLLLEETPQLIDRANVPVEAIHIFLSFLHFNEIASCDDVHLCIYVIWLCHVSHVCCKPKIETQFYMHMNQFLSEHPQQALDVILLLHRLTILYPKFDIYLQWTLSKYGSTHTMGPEMIEDVMRKIPDPSVSSIFLYRMLKPLCDSSTLNQTQTQTQTQTEHQPQNQLESDWLSPSDLCYYLASQTLPPLINLQTSLEKLQLPVVEPDFTLVTSDGEMKCHTWLLYGKWSYFKKMIDFGGVETEKRRMVLSDDWTQHHVQHLIRYLYLESIEINLEMDAMWTLKHAREFAWIDGDFKPMLGFERWIQACLKCVFVPLTVQNCIDLYTKALELTFPQPLEQCYQFLVKSYADIMKYAPAAHALRLLGAETIEKIAYAHYGYAS